MATNPLAPDEPFILHECGGPIAPLGYPFNLVLDMNGPAPDEIWLIKDNKIVLKVTHIGGFSDV